MSGKLAAVFLLTTILSLASGMTANGSDTTPLEGHPFVVSVTINNRHACGGFIYSGYFVVTTATCVFGQSPNDLNVVAGQNSLISFDDPGEQHVRIRYITIHEDYNNNTRWNDIALLETARPFTFDEYVNFVLYNGVNVSQEATIYGWGATKAGIFQLSNNLRRGSFPVRTDCREYSLNEEFYQNYMLCAGQNPFEPIDETTPCLCDLDEGSPAVQSDINGTLYAVGLASKHLTCCTDPENFNAAILTRLSAYYAWLYRNAGPQPPLASYSNN